MSKRPSTLPLALAAGLLSLAIGVGCGGQEGADDGSGKQAPDPEVAATTPETAQSKLVRKAPPTKVEEIVALFPKDVPAWDKATLTDAIGGQEGEGLQELDSEEPPEAAASFYRSKLEALGWDLATEKTVDTFTMLEFTRGEDVLTVTIEPNDRGGSQVNLVNR